MLVCMRAKSFKLSPQLVVQYGGPVLLIDERGIGLRYSLYDRRPGPELNVALGIRGDVIDSDGNFFPDEEKKDEEATLPDGPAVTRVDIRGPIEQRSGYHDVCGGWSDGHDAIAERMIAALELGDVMLVIDSPGGAAAGLQEAVRRVQDAKAKHGRTIVSYADEMVASAAYWWAASVSDEIYGPQSMIVGSIGARSGHESIAGALDKAGVVVTYFVAPGPGKVAFAPELPLSELGRGRGERDTWLAFESFASAVKESRGISRDEIVELNADMLSGQLAVDAKLVEGIASIEEVVEYLTTGVAMTIKNESESGQSAEGNPEPPPADKAECAGCGAANDDDAKYCDKCGTPMALDSDAPSDDDGGEESRSEGEPAKEERTAVPPPPPDKEERVQSHQGKTTAEILGIRPGSSDLAIKNAALRMRAATDRCMVATETKTLDGMVGAVIAQADDARRMAVVEAENANHRKLSASRERMDLLRKLSAANLPGYTRGELFIDSVDDKTGKKTVKAAPIYEEMKLGTLRGFVDSKLKNVAPTARRTPFEPDPKTLVSAGAAGVTEADRQVAAKHGYKPEDVAASRNALGFTGR